MSEANIDNLILNVEVQENKASSKLRSISKSIDVLQSSVDKLNIENLQTKLDSLTKVLNGFENISNVSTSFSKIGTALSKITKINFDGQALYKKFNQLTRIVEPFVKQLQEAETSLVALSKVMSTRQTNISTGTQSTPKTKNTSKEQKSGSNLNIFATLGKWNYYRNMMRYYGKELASIVQLAIDYNETLNLWQVANRDNINGAREFIREMNKAYGISEKTLMNYQAIFKNMLSALGEINSKVSSQLSETLTKMAIDFSSLYNVSIESSMNKFQAVLSGQVRPIRSISGYDITENTIFNIYQQMGGEKTMRQLSQVEKRLLRIYAVYAQMQETGAVGDMAKTLGQSANQLRIMGELWEETTTWIGMSVKQLLDASGILTKINAGLTVARDLFKALAYASGYQEENFLDGMFESAENTNEEIDKLQGKLLSFDKFEALNKSDTSSAIDPAIEKLIAGMNYEIQMQSQEVNDLAQEWRYLLGLIDLNGDGIFEFNDDVKKSFETIKQIVNVLKISFNAFGKIFNKIATIIWNVLTKITPIIEKIFMFLSNIYKTISSTLEKLGVLEPLLIVLMFNALSPLILIVYYWEEIINFIKDAISLIKNGLVIAFKAVANVFAQIINGICNGFIKLINIITTGINYVIDRINDVVYYSGGWIADLFGADTKSGVIPHIPEWKSQVNWQPYAYSTGGFPEDGLFFANSGEMVGKFSNGRTAVANNEQIVQGIQQGVYSAMMAYNAQTGGANGRNGGNGDVYLDGKKVGFISAKYSHNENVRTGLVKVNR